MASIRKADYYTMKVSQRPGAGAKLLSTMKDAGVNLLAFTGFPTGGGAQVDFMPYNPKKFVEAASKLGYKVSAKKTVFLATGKDRTGAVASICSKLAAAGINMVAMDAVSSGAGRFGAIFWVKPADVAKASRALNAS